MLVYLFSLLAFFIPQTQYLVLNILIVAFLGYLWAFENVVLLAIRRYSKVNIFNPYLCTQILISIFNKAGIIALGVVAGILFKYGSMASLIISLLSIVSVILD